MVVAVVGFYVLSNATLCLCLKRRGLAWSPWSPYKSACVVGKFLKTIFITLCNIGMVPFMCFLHPNGMESVLKYPNTFCTSAEHVTMQILGRDFGIDRVEDWSGDLNSLNASDSALPKACVWSRPATGVAVLFLCLTHFIVCAWACYKAPSWSRESREKLKAIAFLMSNFRPSTWWFGLLYMLRGALLSLPAVIATNTPGLNLVLMGSVIQVIFTVQLYFLPWRAAILNMIDAMSTLLFLILLALCLRLEPTADGSLQTLDTLGVSFYYLSLGVVLSVMVMAAALMIWQRCTSNLGELKVVNLGQVPDAAEIMQELEDVASQMESMRLNRKERLVEKLAKLISAYDLWTLRRALDILLDDCELGRGQSRRVAASRRSAGKSRIEYLSRDTFSTPAEGGHADDMEKDSVSRDMEDESVSVSF